MAVRRSCRRSAPPRPTRHSGGAFPRLAARIKNGAFLEYRKRVDYHIGSIFDIPKTANVFDTTTALDVTEDAPSGVSRRTFCPSAAVMVACLIKLNENLQKPQQSLK